MHESPDSNTIFPSSNQGSPRLGGTTGDGTAMSAREMRQRGASSAKSQGVSVKAVRETGNGGSDGGGKVAIDKSDGGVDE